MPKMRRGRSPAGRARRAPGRRWRRPAAGRGSGCRWSRARGRRPRAHGRDRSRPHAPTRGSHRPASFALRRADPAGGSVAGVAVGGDRLQLPSRLGETLGWVVGGVEAAEHVSDGGEARLGEVGPCPLGLEPLLGRSGGAVGVVEGGLGLVGEAVELGLALGEALVCGAELVRDLLVLGAGRLELALGLCGRRAAASCSSWSCCWRSATCCSKSSTCCWSSAFSCSRPALACSSSSICAELAALTSSWSLWSTAAQIASPITAASRAPVRTSQPVGRPDGGGVGSRLDPSLRQPSGEELERLAGLRLLLAAQVDALPRQKRTRLGCDLERLAGQTLGRQLEQARSIGVEPDLGDEPAGESEGAILRLRTKIGPRTPRSSRARPSGACGVARAAPW